MKLYSSGFHKNKVSKGENKNACHLKFVSFIFYLFTIVCAVTKQFWKNILTFVVCYLFLKSISKPDSKIQWQGFKNHALTGKHSSYNKHKKPLRRRFIGKQSNKIIKHTHILRAWYVAPSNFFVKKWIWVNWVYE